MANKKPQKKAQEKLSKINSEVSTELFMRFKICVTKQRKTMTSVLTDFLKHYVEKHNG